MLIIKVFSAILEKIIDIHLFRWDLNRLDYYWIKNGTAASRPFEWTAEDIKPAVELVLKEFGVDRIFCGSDWPVCLLAGSYEYTWQQYKAVMQSILNEDEAEKVYFSNAQFFYNI